MRANTRFFLLLHAVGSSPMADNANSNNQVEQDKVEREKRVSELLEDNETREMLVRKLMEGGHVAKPATLGAGTFMSSLPGGSADSGSSWPQFPMQLPFAAPFPRRMYTSAYGWTTRQRYVM